MEGKQGFELIIVISGGQSCSNSYHANIEEDVEDVEEDDSDEEILYELEFDFLIISSIQIIVSSFLKKYVKTKKLGKNVRLAFYSENQKSKSRSTSISVLNMCVYVLVPVGVLQPKRTIQR